MRIWSSLRLEVDGQITAGEQDLVVQAAPAGSGIAFAFEAQVAELIARAG